MWLMIFGLCALYVCADIIVESMRRRVLSKYPGFFEMSKENKLVAFKNVFERRKDIIPD